MEGEYEACEEYSKTWLSQVLEWMGEVGVRVERNGEEGEQRQGRMLVECVGKEWRHRVLVICRRAEVYWEEEVVVRWGTGGRKVMPGGEQWGRWCKEGQGDMGAVEEMRRQLTGRRLVRVQPGKRRQRV
jgi:hypothetical protein